MAEAAVTAMWSAFDPSSAAHTLVGGTAFNLGVLFYTSVLRPGFIRDTVWNAVSFILSTATGCIFTGVVFYSAAAKPLQELCLFLHDRINNATQSNRLWTGGTARNVP